MNHRNDGFIFLLTLCIILVISLLIITCLQHVLLYHKALNRQELQHHRFYQLEKLARHLARLPLQTIDKKCIESGDDANVVLKLLAQNQGCIITVEHASYRYIIEDLGNFPCLVFHQLQLKQATHHIRLSLMSLAEEEHPASILQIRYIKSSRVKGCLGQERSVTRGISSWRYIPDILTFS